MDPVRLPPVISYGEETLRPVQVEPHSVNVNYSLTIPELMCIGLLKTGIASSLANEGGLLYLGTSITMQSRFIQAIGQTGQLDTFRAEELNLQRIVTSLWTKSRAFTENRLVQSQKEDDIAEERYMQKEADEAMKLFTDPDKFGKVFTPREATCLVDSFEFMIKSVQAKIAATREQEKKE